VVLLVAAPEAQAANAAAARRTIVGRASDV
jgi:hypothetical protein